MNERWKVSKITKKNIKSIKRYMTKQKVLRFIKMTLLVIGITLILLSLLGTVAQAAGLVDDTVSAENLYSKYPLQNYTLDFYVDNSWGWLPWNWLDGIGKKCAVRTLLYYQFHLDNQSIFKQCHRLCRTRSL